MLRPFPVVSVVLAASLAGADGLMLPVERDYPHEFLRNRVTQARVEVRGLVTVTSVYQEFVNEWHRQTDAVYSFPLPPEARATEVLYWRGEEALRAVLRVRDQAVNPGTGEGGAAALVNRYLGRNGIRFKIDGIEPHGVQRVQLTYIGLCEYTNGECRYRYPLDTGDFVTWPLEHLQFSFIVRSNSDIVDFGLPTHPEYRTVHSAPREVEVEFSRPKSYLNRDLEFYYTVEQTALGVDFYSAANDTSDGHFALLLRPKNPPDEGSVLPRRVFFLLSNSGRMVGSRLDQSIRAISKSLEKLRPGDLFNILLFNNRVMSWKPAPVPADGVNVAAAVEFLKTVETAVGSRLDEGLKSCLSQVSSDHFSNAVLVFTDGRSPLDPREIESLNEHRAAIFPIGIGPDLDRARLEMTAALNYGFVTYIDDYTSLEETMAGVLERIGNPILKNTVMEYGRADLSQVFPRKLPDTYSGSFLFVTGRYKTPGCASAPDSTGNRWCISSNRIPPHRLLVQFNTQSRLVRHHRMPIPDQGFGEQAVLVDEVAAEIAGQGAVRSGGGGVEAEDVKDAQVDVGGLPHGDAGGIGDPRHVQEAPVRRSDVDPVHGVARYHLDHLTPGSAGGAR